MMTQAIGCVYVWAYVRRIVKEETLTIYHIFHAYVKIPSGRRNGLMFPSGGSF